jgi:hypothetical protein
VPAPAPDAGPAPSATPVATPATPLSAGRLASTSQSNLQLFEFGYDSTNESSNQVKGYLCTSSVAPMEVSRSTKCGSLDLSSVVLALPVRRLLRLRVVSLPIQTPVLPPTCAHSETALRMFSASMIELPACTMPPMPRIWMSLYCLFASAAAVGDGCCLIADPTGTLFASPALFVVKLGL